MAPSNPIEQRYFTKILEQIHILIEMSWKAQENISIIIFIVPGNTKISLIPRYIREDINHILTIQYGEKNTLLGYGISSEEIRGFLRKECGIKSDSIQE